MECGGCGRVLVVVVVGGLLDAGLVSRASACVSPALFVDFPAGFPTPQKKKKKQRRKRREKQERLSDEALCKSV